MQVFTASVSVPLCLQWNEQPSRSLPTRVHLHFWTVDVFFLKRTFHCCLRLQTGHVCHMMDMPNSPVIAHSLQMWWDRRRDTRHPSNYSLGCLSIPSSFSLRPVLFAAVVKLKEMTGFRRSVITICKSDTSLLVAHYWDEYCKRVGSIHQSLIWEGLIYRNLSYIVTLYYVFSSQSATCLSAANTEDNKLWCW